MNQIIETMYTNILTNFNVNFEMITNVNIEENYILYCCIVSTNEIKKYNLESGTFLYLAFEVIENCFWLSKYK